MPQKMKKYDTFDLWAADQHTKQKRIISALRKLMKKREVAQAIMTSQMKEALGWVAPVEDNAFRAVLSELHRVHCNNGRHGT